MKAYQRGCKSELLVMSDLTAKDYGIYTSVSRHDWFDIVIAQKEQYYCIEVKTCAKFMRVSVHWKRNPDILALVSQTGAILYLPGKRFSL